MCSTWESRAGPFADPVITCIDCLGPAYLLSTRPADDPALPGDVVSYRCRDCGDRWDLVVPEPPPGGVPERAPDQPGGRPANGPLADGQPG